MGAAHGQGEVQNSLPGGGGVMASQECREYAEAILVAEYGVPVDVVEETVERALRRECGVLDHACHTARQLIAECMDAEL